MESSNVINYFYYVQAQYQYKYEWKRGEKK